MSFCMVCELLKIKLSSITQKQLASTFDLTVWHLTHTNSVSLQLFVQRGIKEQNPPPRMKQATHQIIATIPTFFLGMFPVSLAHEGQGDPSPPLFPPPPTVMTVGPAAGGGGGGITGTTGATGMIGATGAIIGAGAIMGAGAIIGAPYISYKTIYEPDELLFD